MKADPDSEEPQTSEAYGNDVVCEACGGAGSMDDETECEECGGTGKIRHT